MHDGVATYEEYDAAFKRYLACMKEAGYGVVVLDPDPNGTFNARIPNEAVVSGKDDECYHTHFAAVDSAWQIANEDTSAAAESLRECLRAHGVDPAEKMEDILGQFEEEELGIDEC